MKHKIFVAIDTKSKKRAMSIINQSELNNFKIGYKFGLEFLNSKNGRNFISKLKKKIIFIDLKLHDIPNTMKSTLIALKDLKINYLTVHISAGLKALKDVKKVSGKIKIVGVTTLTSLYR
ncbi:MAG: orotidine 5'-phosphate decarboxylase / HUMPS family protein [Candidatus Pelagibacter sp.]